MRKLSEYLKSRRAVEWGSLFIPLVIGLYLRGQTLRWHRLFAYDPYYFYRVATHIANGGSIFDRDPMIVTLSRRFIDDEPGLPLIWGYLSKITHVSTWTLGIYLPLIIFVLEVLLLYKLAKDAFNWRIGVVSALFLAVVPGHIYRTHAGGIWKDTLGSLFMLMFLHSVILITKSDELNHRKMINYGAYLVTSLYLSAFTFDGFAAFPGAVSLYLILLPIIKKPRKNEFFIAGLMAVPLILAYITLPTYTREPYELLPFLIASILNLGTLGLGYYFYGLPRGKLIYGGILSLVSAGLAYVALYNPPEFLEKTSRMIWMFLLPDKYGLSAQSRPNNLKLLFDTWFSTSLIFAGVGLVYIVKYIKQRLNLLVLSWFAFSVFLGVSTVRLTFVMSFAIAVVAALGVELIYLELLGRLDFKKAAAISFVVLLIGIVPTFQAGKDYASMPPYPPDYWLDALEWMHDNINGSVVFNWWDWGYWLEAYGVKTVGDNGYQGGLSSAAYANLMLSNYSSFPYWMNKYSKTVSAVSLKRRGENISVDYLIVSPELIFSKFGALVDAYNILVKVHDYPLNRVKLAVLYRSYGSPSVVVYKNRDIVLSITRSGKIYLSNEGSQIEIRDVVFEKQGPNKIIHLSPHGVIVYINGPYAAVFNEESFSTTLVQLVVYENPKYARSIRDIGSIKVYVLP